MIGPLSDLLPVARRSPRQATEICTATYTTTQADVDRGSITNTGTAPAPRRSDHRCSATSQATVPPTCLRRSRWARRRARSSFTEPGTVITYSYVVTNTGNVTLSGDRRHRPDDRPVGHRLPESPPWRRVPPRRAPRRTHHPGRCGPWSGRQHRSPSGHRFAGRERDRSGHSDRSRHPDARHRPDQERQRQTASRPPTP